MVCLSIYYEKNTVKTALTMMGLFFAKELNFCPSDINVSCVKIAVFETHFKIFNSCFLYIQQVVTRNKFISYRPRKLMTLNFLTVRKSMYKFTTNNSFLSCKQKLLLYCYVIPVLCFPFLFLRVLYFPWYVEYF